VVVVGLAGFAVVVEGVVGVFAVVVAAVVVVVGGVVVGVEGFPVPTPLSLLPLLLLLLQPEARGDPKQR